MFRKIGPAIGRVLAMFVRAVPDIIRDLVGLAATGSIAYGAWLIYQPAGFIVAGVLVLVGVIATGKSRATGG